MSDHKTARQKRLERYAGRIPNHVHGYNGYNNYGCRCDICTQGLADYQFNSQQNRAAKLGECVIEGCTKGQYSKGLCKPHYERQRTGMPLTAIIRERRMPRGKRGKKRKST